MTGDLAGIESLYPEAFPDEDLLPLVRELLQAPDIALSLTATIDSDVAGHAVFTTCGVDGSDAKAALLGPVAVAPARQKLGIGSALIRDGLNRMHEDGVAVVCVLGDPAYYSRLGFRPESLIRAPYPLPDEWKDAWQSQYLDDAITLLAGALLVPRQWRDPALWLP